MHSFLRESVSENKFAGVVEKERLQLFLLAISKHRSMKEGNWELMQSLCKVQGQAWEPTSSSSFPV